MALSTRCHLPFCSAPENEHRKALLPKDRRRGVARAWAPARAVAKLLAHREEHDMFESGRLLGPARVEWPMWPVALALQAGAPGWRAAIAASGISG